jgi:hypothetical protein
MQRTRLLALTFISIAGLPLMAQGGGHAVEPQSSPAVQVPTTAASQPTADGAAATAEMKPVNTELVGKLDSKTAKPGDKVIAETKEDVKTADGTDIPKGSRLIGEVTAVKPHSKEVQNSEVAVRFDRAELKNGQDLAIRSTIQSIAPPEDAMANNSPDMGAPMAGPAATGGSMAGSRTGATSVPAAPNGMTPGTAATDSRTTTQGSNNTSAAGKVVSGSGADAIRTTDVPGVFLASNANAPISGTLFATKSNVHLDGGTRMVLNVADANGH